MACNRCMLTIPNDLHDSCTALVVGCVDMAWIGCLHACRVPTDGGSLCRQSVDTVASSFTVRVFTQESSCVTLHTTGRHCCLISPCSLPDTPCVPVLSPPALSCPHLHSADYKCPGLHKPNGLPATHTPPPAAAGAGVSLSGLTPGACRVLVDWAAGKRLLGSLLTWGDEVQGFTLAWRD